VEHARVGRHAIAGLEQDDVARHELGGVDVALVPVAQHPCVGTRQLRRAAIDCSARYSCVKPTTALIASTSAMTAASMYSRAGS
jgi:hypothetical protein